MSSLVTRLSYDGTLFAANGQLDEVTYTTNKILTDGTVCTSELNEQDLYLKWNETSLTALTPWAAVVFGNGKFVAISEDGLSAYTVDGINWVSGASLPQGVNWNSIAFGNGVFVALGDAYYNPTDMAAYSYDGINWFSTPLPSVQLWYKICFGNNMFVTMGAYSGETPAYSYDGINWFSSPTVLPYSYDNNIVYGNGKFVTFQPNFTNNMPQILESTDGINWVTRQAISSNLNGNTGGVSENNLYFLKDLFILAYRYGRSSSEIQFSRDGVNWSASVSTAGSFNGGIAYGSGTFVGLGNASTTTGYIYYSHDLNAAGWQIKKSVAGRIPLTSLIIWTGVAYGNGIFVAISAGGPFIPPGWPPYLTSVAVYALAIPLKREIDNKLQIANYFDEVSMK
jgi:hypothetical protein